MKTGPEYLQSAEKRSLDVSTALGALAAGALPFAAGIGAAYIASGSGRPFFDQERDNYRGGTFTLHKLRSLNDTKVSEGVQADYGTIDPRTGRLGNLLRATGVDEIPQLVNILEGSMSFVGPRPLPRFMLKEWRKADPVLYDEWYDASSAAKPGLVSPGTILRKTETARGHEMVIRSMRADLEYVHEASVAEDVRVIGRTALIAGKLFGKTGLPLLDRHPVRTVGYGSSINQ